MRLYKSAAIIVVLLLGMAAPCAASVFRCTPPQAWSVTFGTPPDIVLAGDVDGDGYGDLISVNTVGPARVDVSINARGVKACEQIEVLKDFGNACIGAISGEFDGKRGTDIVGVFYDNTIRLAASLKTGAPGHASSIELGKLSVHPEIPIYLAAGDVNGDNRDEVVAVEVGGRAWLISISNGSAPVAVVKQIGSLDKAQRPCLPQQ